MTSAKLPAYAAATALDTPFDRSLPSVVDAPSALATVIAWLLDEAGHIHAGLPDDERERTRLLKRLLTVRPPRPFPGDVWDALDVVFATATRQRQTVSLERALGAASGVRGGRTTVGLWRGDITTLALDAIVNAANADLLGCFRPEHACIDNAIHAAAGPRLREDCHCIMTFQGHREATGTAKVTRAYYLPSRFVLHTVGPIVPNGHVTAEHRSSLARCYDACLDLAVAVGARSVALCAVSTGVFGYPKNDAAAVAVATVQNRLARHSDAIDAVMFNVFGATDEQAYLETGFFS